MGRSAIMALAVAMLAVGVSSCFSPSPAAGLPCSDGEPRCPAGQVCNEAAAGGPTCELPGGDPDAAPGSPDGDTVDAPPGSPDAPRGSPDAMPAGGPVNDTPGGAIDVGTGGDFVIDTTGAHDDFDATVCSGPGGLDVFYKLTVTSEEVVYIDMFGTDFDGVLVIRNGDCTPIGTGVDCRDDTCGNGWPQGAWDLDAGTYCLIVDQGGGAETDTHGELHVRRTGQPGTGFPDTAGTVAGTTCGADDTNTAECGCNPSPELWYFLTICPGDSTTIHADVCTTSMYDAVEEIRDIDLNSLDCNDDSACGDSSVDAFVDTPGLYWVIQDACSGCGQFTMNYSY